MKPTVVHVISGLGSGEAAHMLTRLILADRGPRASRQVVVSLTKGGRCRHALQDAGIEVHCLGLAQLSRMPRTFFRLVVLMRRVQPDVVMTWSAHVLATLAAVASGVGASRVVWNLSASSRNASDRTLRTRFKLMLLAGLSPFPWAIAVGSLSGRRAYDAWGFRPRRWFRLYNSTRESAIERVLGSYRQLWRFASGIEPFPVRPGFLERRIYPRLKNWWAQLRRLLLTKTTFIAITGSCGKSTTTRLAAAILKTNGPCCLQLVCTRAWGSLRTVLSVPTSTKYCVLEVSGHLPGEIAKHVRVVRPHIAIVTNVGTDHYTTFRGLEATAKEKGQLVQALPRRGIAILNADDPHVRAMAARTRARVLLFGLSPDAEIRAAEVSSAWPDRLALTVVHGHESVRIQTNLAGEHWITSVLAAMACGVVCGLDLRTFAKVVETFDPLFGRYSVHAKPGGAVYVLDSHKAPVWTVPKGLAFVERAKAPRKTIVFGTISDMPGRGRQKYRKIAREALGVADRVVFVGPNAASVSKLRQGELQERLFAFETSYQASAFLAEEVLPEELIYIKASGTADHLERIMLSQLDEVVCWRERCRRQVACHNCPDFRMPYPPPFGLAESNSLVAARLP